MPAPREPFRIRMLADADAVRGLRMTYEAPPPRDFTARFERA